MKESDNTNSDKLDELAELLRQLDRRRGLSVQQVLGLLFSSLLLIFIVGLAAVFFLGMLFGPIFASVFIAMIMMFIFEDMRSSNITKRSKFGEDTEEDQETLEEFDEEKAEV